MGPESSPKLAKLPQLRQQQTLLTALLSTPSWSPRRYEACTGAKQHLSLIVPSTALLVHAHTFSLTLRLSLILLIVFSASFLPLICPDSPSAARAFPHLRGLLLPSLLVLVASSPPPFLSLFLCATQINAIVSWLAIVLRKS